MIPEDQINIQKIAEIFQSAFMDVNDITDTRLSVKGVIFPFLLGVNIDTERKIVRFNDYNKLHRLSIEAAAQLCNEANKTYFLARFYAFMHERDVMAKTEYEMSYEKGIIPFQVISNFRKFEQIAGTAVRDSFKDYLRP